MSLFSIEFNENYKYKLNKVTLYLKTTANGGISMKKIFLTLMIAMLGMLTLVADDVDDIKAAIIRSRELATKGDPAGAAAFITPDYKENIAGTDINFELIKMMILALDGKHQTECFLFIHALSNKGEMPSATWEKIIRETANQQQKEYEKFLTEFPQKLKSPWVQKSESLDFLSVCVNGDSASVLLNYLLGGEDRYETISLRKIDGKWKICRCAPEE